MTNGSVIRDQDSPSSIADVARSSRANQIAWNWIRDHWSTLFEKFGKSDNNLDEIIEAVSSRFVTVRQRDEFKTFADSIIDKGKRFRFVLLTCVLLFTQVPCPVSFNYPWTESTQT